MMMLDSGEVQPQVRGQRPEVRVREGGAIMIDKCGFCHEFPVSSGSNYCVLCSAIEQELDYDRMRVHAVAASAIRAWRIARIR